MSKKSDIVIVGAGLIGTSFALSIAQADFSIRILENHLPDVLSQANTHSRPISLSYGSYRILNTLGVWSELEKNACPILSVHVSEKGKLGVTHFSAKEENIPALGFVVPFSVLQLALYQHAASRKNITVTSIQTIEKINNHVNGVDIKIKTNNGDETIFADLLVAADGTQSHCRELLKINHAEKKSGDVAHIYQLTLSEQHNHTAYERFTNCGVLALLPLFEKNKAQLVWTITPRVAKKMAAWNHDAILYFLQETFEGRLLIADAKKITEFPLKTVIAKKQIAQSAVLLGNAAHTIYPVAAQGFNLGLHDVAILANILMKAKKNNKRIEEWSLLKKYEEQINDHQQAIFCVTNSLTSIFELPFIGNLRGLGLLTTDLMHPIKKKLVNRAMGNTNEKI
ncbi:MAG: hypothetical protein A3C44_04810 [Gammaproteobacteria bacterium RIFCSPHIGHO2_02_FULL_39_13]|nr:MAG: hypothetical protein A3C44_04810 [Gammaproteobacteria bacterium RIFCSPHIGHO2_02_FULL_39_13]OGT50609.1 MAG: hypothetical protein A3E53_03250 [Gammaproteobacteria bacterium RIFCSPHIGHO2_12_FULL_39_24]